MGWHCGGSGKETIVSNFKGIVPFLNLPPVFRFVVSHKGDLLAVGPPCEMLDAVGDTGEPKRIATIHWHDEYLRFFFLARPGLRQKGEPVS